MKDDRPLEAVITSGLKNPSILRTIAYSWLCHRTSCASKNAAVGPAASGVPSSVATPASGAWDSANSLEREDGRELWMLLEFCDRGSLLVRPACSLARFLCAGAAWIWELPERLWRVHVPGPALAAASGKDGRQLWDVAGVPPLRQPARFRVRSGTESGHRVTCSSTSSTAASMQQMPVDPASTRLYLRRLCVSSWSAERPRSCEMAASCALCCACVRGV